MRASTRPINLRADGSQCAAPATSAPVTNPASAPAANSGVRAGSEPGVRVGNEPGVRAGNDLTSAPATSGVRVGSEPPAGGSGSVASESSVLDGPLTELR